MNILQKIFSDHYEEIKFTLHPRKTEMENIDKMLNCGSPSFGGAMYGCPHCGKLKFVPFRCKSRFCPTCGNKYAMERTTSMSFKLVNARHRHCVFTIDEQLRDFFLNDRSLLDCLFHAVNSVVSRMFFKQNQSMNFTPGFIMVLHTFGRDLKWNPHIHCLISEGGYSDNGFWRNVNHFNYTFLRNSFRTALLNEMEHRIGHSFNKVKARCYREHREGFYVYAKPNKCDPKTVVKYIGRYLGRPVIATARIDQYDGDFVSFHYNRHEDNACVEETLPVMEFIERLIRHIPEKYYKMIRYGGIYARHREIDKKLHRVISREKHSIYRSFNQWRTAILFSFGYDPLTCECGTTLLFLELYFNHKVFLWKKCTRKSCPALVEEGRPPDFPKSRSYGILLSKEAVPMNPNTEKLRKKYMNNPPEGMTSEDMRRMRGDDLLDMDYFLNEEDPFEDDFGEEGFYIF